VQFTSLIIVLVIKNKVALAYTFLYPAYSLNTSPIGFSVFIFLEQLLFKFIKLIKLLFEGVALGKIIIKIQFRIIFQLRFYNFSNHSFFDNLLLNIVIVCYLAALRRSGHSIWLTIVAKQIISSWLDILHLFVYLLIIFFVLLPFLNHDLSFDIYNGFTSYFNVAIDDLFNVSNSFL